MALIVILDTNVLMAWCLDPTMDPKRLLAAQVFDVLREAEIEPQITESVSREFEERLRAKIGQVVDGARRLAGQPAPLPVSAKTTTLRLMETIFSRLRSDMP